MIAADTGDVVQNPFNQDHEVGGDDESELGDYAPDENIEPPTLLKPVFVSKQDRELLTITEEKRKQLEAEE